MAAIFFYFEFWFFCCPRAPDIAGASIFGALDLLLEAQPMFNARCLQTMYEIIEQT